MNVWTPNNQDSPHLFSMAVTYKVSLHVCDYLSLDISIISKKNVK